MSGSPWSSQRLRDGVLERAVLPPQLALFCPSLSPFCSVHSLAPFPRQQRFKLLKRSVDSQLQMLSVATCIGRLCSCFFRARCRGQPVADTQHISTVAVVSECQRRSETKSLSTRSSEIVIEAVLSKQSSRCSCRENLSTSFFFTCLWMHGQDV